MPCRRCHLRVLAQGWNRVSGFAISVGRRLETGRAEPGIRVVELAISIALMTGLGRWLGLTPKLTSLLAIGSSICGVSAIIAAKGAIEADDEEVSYAIAAILALGAFSLFAFPLSATRSACRTMRSAFGRGWP
jgi:uncharacterized membrane protein YadS